MDTSLFFTIGNELHFANGMVVKFEHPIGEVLRMGDILVVQIWPGREIYNENIFGVDLTGHILWQIERLYPVNVEGAFGGLEKIGDYVVVSNTRNDFFYLEPATGHVVKRGVSAR